MYLTPRCPSSSFSNPSPIARILIVSPLPINGLLPKHLQSGTSQLLPSSQRPPEYSFLASIPFSSSPSLPGNNSLLACPLPHLLFSILHPLVLWLPSYAQVQWYAKGINWNQILDNSQILEFHLILRKSRYIGKGLYYRVFPNRPVLNWSLFQRP